MKRPALLQRLAIGALFAAVTSMAGAQPYPNKPLRIVVPFGAASSTDLFARTLAKVIAPEFGQPIVVENLAGAEGFIGSENVARAAPDGYSLLFTSSSTHVLNVHLYKKLPYDPFKDYTHVTTVAAFQIGMNVKGDSPMKSVTDVINAAKANPGKLTFGSGSATTRLAGEMFQQMTGVKLLHVPYKTLAAAVTDLGGGQIDLVWVDLPTTRPHHASGRVRILASTGDKRMGALPNVPTIAEAGVPGYSFTGWWGVFAPANTPAPIVQRLEGLISKGMKTPPLAEFLQNGALDLFLTPTSEFVKFHQADVERWGKVIKAAGMEPK